MGANTYIGNGPDLMGKSIAEAQGVEISGFFACMAYTMLLLIPVLSQASWRFFS